MLDTLLMSVGGNQRLAAMLTADFFAKCQRRIYDRAARYAHILLTQNVTQCVKPRCCQRQNRLQYKSQVPMAAHLTSLRG